MSDIVLLFYLLKINTMVEIMEYDKSVLVKKQL
jgi:hypothetical protein